MKVWIGLCLLATTLGAQADETSDLIEATKAAVAAKMKDPAAAQFKDVVVLDGGKTRAICGEVNGKNSYGGYVGFRKFYKYEDRPNVVIKSGDKIMDQLVDLVCKPP